ncbi:MAG: hypothetical protein KDH09_05875 [Chrysiogenetes bacterium]|nr:hypothetical protein [Chrysiogenetes bacterium]
MALFGKKQVKGGGSGQETRWVRLGPDCDVLRLYMEKADNTVAWTSPAFKAYEAFITKGPLEFLVPPKERIEARVVHVRGGGRASMHGFHLVLQAGGRENLRRLTGVEGVNADHFTPELIQRAQAAAKARASGQTQPPFNPGQTQPPAPRQPVVPHTPQPQPVASMQPPGAAAKSSDLGDFGEFSEPVSGEAAPPPPPADTSEYLGGDIGELGPSEEEFQSYMAGGRAPGDELPDEEREEVDHADVVEEAELVEFEEAEELGGEDLGGEELGEGLDDEVTAPSAGVDLAQTSEFLAPEDEDHPFAEDADAGSPFEDANESPFADDGAEEAPVEEIEEAEPIEDVAPIEEPEPLGAEEVAEEESEELAPPEEPVLVPPEEEVSLEPPEVEESAFEGGGDAGDDDPFAALNEGEPEETEPEAADAEDAFAEAEAGAPDEAIAEAAEEIGLAGEEAEEPGEPEEAPHSLAEEAVQMAEEVAGEPMSGTELDAAGDEPAAEEAQEEPEVAEAADGWGIGEGGDEAVSMGDSAEESEKPVAVDEEADEEPVEMAEEPVAVDESGAEEAVEEPVAAEADEPEMAARFAHDDAQYLEGLDDLDSEAPAVAEEDEIGDAEEEAVGLGDEEIVDAEDFMRGVAEDEPPSDERYEDLSTKEDVAAAIEEAERLAREAGAESQIVTRSAAEEMPASVLPQGEGAIGRVSEGDVKEVRREKEEAEAFIDIAGDDEIQQALSDAGDVVMMPVDPSEQPERPSGNFAAATESAPEPVEEDEPIGMAEDEASESEEPIGMAEEEPVAVAEEAADEPVAMDEEPVAVADEEPGEEAAEEYDWLPFDKERSDALKVDAKNAGVAKKLDDRLVFQLQLRVRFPDGHEASGPLCLFDKRPALMEDESATPRHLTRDCFIAYL